MMATRRPIAVDSVGCFDCGLLLHAACASAVKADYVGSFARAGEYDGAADPL